MAMKASRIRISPNPSSSSASLFLPYLNSKNVLLVVQMAFAALLCGSSYLAGSLWGRHAFETSSVHMSVGNLVRRETKEGSLEADNVDCDKVMEQVVASRVKEELKKHRDQLKSSPQSSSSDIRRFPKGTQRFANGMARIKKDKLNEFFDFGNPMERGAGTGEEDALIIYHDKKSMPSSDPSLRHAAEYDNGEGIPLADPQTATENCDTMNVVFTSNPGMTQQCTAIIGNFESYHIQRWMRVANSSAVDSKYPLSLVSRGYAPNGKQNFIAPSATGNFSPVKRHWKMLRTFLQNVDSIVNDLKPILKKVARNNTVVIMTCNHGQSALLMNFACSAKRRGFDLGNVLVFPTDIETKELADGLGLATYYDEKNMGPLPSGEARRYGDKNFKAMMYAKVLCVMYPLLLNYDVLFQDVDLVWYKDPVAFFHNESSKTSQFDVIFQHDGSNSVRYAPYSANSGFYYVRCNKRTQYLFASLLYHSDLIISWDSHQQVLVQLLSDHSSLFGLNVKVFHRDTEMFPGGYHYHRKKDFMKKLIMGKTDSYIFHMSWTENKDNKLLFFRQMGEWYLEDACIGKKAGEIFVGGASSGSDAPLVQPCCAEKPIFSCHYRDKPSRLPCKTSDPIDANGRSFW